MIQIQHVDLPAHTNRKLSDLQGQVDAGPSYADRVQLARTRFEAENRSGNDIFDVIKRTLGSMCEGAGRCMYCEDSLASEVEHFRPKTFYPELVFVWLNYLYSCGPCNRVKRSHFRILVENSEYVDLTRHRNRDVIEPPNGPPVLIDPRSDDPLKYLRLDLVDTFWFVPRHAEGTHEYVRAEYTIRCLKLNERDFLPRARQEAYEGYRARLVEYVDARNKAEAEHLAKAISRCGHRAVWAEMKAQSLLLPDISKLFIKAPEALQL
jgi:uncharacterized protein (TIGR02646 family)